MIKISKNKKYQYLFFFIITIYTIFNGGNSNLLIQINFLLLGFLFIFCTREKNYKIHLNFYYKKNKKFFIFYFLFIIYLCFLIIPLPIEILKFFSIKKYIYLIKLDSNINFSSISLSPSDTFFQILNFLSMLFVVLIFKMIFFNSKHLCRIYLFLSFIGFVTALLGVILYLNSSSLFFINKTNYYDAASSFFVNRTTFSIYLLFCFMASVELLKNYSNKFFFKEKNIFFYRSYIRIFIIFISIGIITSFSRIGNFLFILTIILYLINNIYYKKNKNINFTYLLFVILLFDIIVLGFYFGSEKILERFLFLKDEFSNILIENPSLSRFQLIKFGMKQIPFFLFFGYGPGSFEILFNIEYLNETNFFANHSHSSLVEFIGEFGLIGSFLLLASISKIFFLKNTFDLNRLILLIILLVVIVFDFSLHMPIIQLLFVIFFILRKRIY